LDVENVELDKREKEIKLYITELSHVVHILFSMRRLGWNYNATTASRKQPPTPNSESVIEDLSVIGKHFYTFWLTFRHYVD